MEEKNEVLNKTKLQQWCEEKTEKIIDDLDKFFNNFPDYKSMNIYPIFSNILSCNNKLLLLKDRKFENEDDVEFCFQCFQDIISTINLKVVYVPSQQTFCMFMGWTDRIYKEMLKSNITEIQDMMQFIEQYLIENQMSAGQVGLTKQNLTKFRAQLAGDHGQNLVTQKEQNEDKRARRLQSKDELFKKLKDMGYTGPTIDNVDNSSNKKR